MKHKGLKELIELRRLHERRALDNLSVQEAALKNAHHAIASAQKALEDHQTWAIIQENELFERVIGKPVQQTEIVIFQATRQDLDFVAEKLLETQAQAVSNARQKQQEVVQAQKNVRLRQQAVLKLEEFTKKHSRIMARRIDSLSDLD